MFQENPGVIQRSIANALAPAQAAPATVPTPRLNPRRVPPITRNFPEFDASLAVSMCDRYNNAELTLTMRIHFEQNNPASGAATGVFRDYNSATGTQRDIVSWDPGAWAVWKSTFINQAQTFWTDRIWLCNDGRSMGFSDGGAEYFPNIWCRFRLVEAPRASAHHSVLITRLAAHEPFAGSNTAFFDSNDIKSVSKRYLADGTSTTSQRASVHEIGHLLGLPHINDGKGKCVGGNINHSSCYGVTDTELLSVMGAGEELRISDAEPWRRAARALAPVQPPLLPSTWEAKLRRHYPRTAEQVMARQHVTSRPNRG